MTMTPGTRMKCAECGSEAIVLRGEAPELTCCDGALEEIFSPDRPAADA